MVSGSPTWHWRWCLLVVLVRWLAAIRQISTTVPTVVMLALCLPP